MKFSKVLALALSTASVVHAVPLDQRDAGLEARGCGYKDCDECHLRDNFCVYCDTGGGIGVSSIRSSD
ncbi:hypothetical protein BDV26DRAFT_296055 [Aspergillus bertholletiae]|uniref:Uncharacterized protein n=1 Tax=Aspergillus bertholletiae TaxID=1226010 RepID=A0A5N7AWX5_9EURO|nr:hypothetical protein BDV26DRAFT_296055 [Aspergillus bertholletiae]